MNVMKFGGTSLANPDAIRRCAELVEREGAQAREQSHHAAGPSAGGVAPSGGIPKSMPISGAG